MNAIQIHILLSKVVDAIKLPNVEKKECPLKQAISTRLYPFHYQNVFLTCLHVQLLVYIQRLGI